MQGRIPLKTKDDLVYKYHAVRAGALFIEVKAQSNAHVALTDAKKETNPMYEIMLGGWENTASVIRYDRKKPDKVRKSLMIFFIFVPLFFQRSDGQPFLLVFLLFCCSDSFVKLTTLFCITMINRVWFRSRIVL